MLVLKNKAAYIRRELETELLKLIFTGKLTDEIDNLPRKLYPKNKTPLRCCIYKDRAISTYRIMAILGISIEKELDEAPASLVPYVKQALNRQTVSEPVLTVINEACSACVRTNYLITNACRGCVARPCMLNCPKDAITFENERAKIDPDKCVNCGKCQAVCPYNAIVYQPIPCEQSCPVGAIKKDETGKEYIDYSLCIFCGRCTRACPFGAVMERSQIIDVGHRIMQGKKMVAMVAPSVVGQFPGKMQQIVQAIRNAGFSKVVEVAAGADTTAIKEAEEFTERVIENQEPLMGTSCCPAYVQAVKKHVPDFEKYVSNTRTPMSYTAEIVTKQWPDAIKVFIGPCIAKKFEGIHDPNVDYVLTYEELGAFFVSKQINTADCCESDFDLQTASKHGRGFPVSTGVACAVQHYVGDKGEVKPVLIDGLGKKGLNQLKLFSKGKAPGNLIEVMSCEGGCICGPGVVSNPKITKHKLKEFLDETNEKTNNA
jgi:[FeFe] hydrogenase (group B1/B3)